MMTSEKMKRALDSALWEGHRQVVKLGYPSPYGYFARMLDKLGSVATVKALVLSAQPPSGFTWLWEHHHLQFSVEAIVVDGWETWGELFKDENVRVKAIERLGKYGYHVKTPREKIG
jgi:hypothetical protein